MKQSLRNQLVKLLTENPKLDVITLVGYEVVCSDEHNWWQAEIESVKIEFYAKLNGVDGPVSYHSEKEFRAAFEERYEDYCDDKDYMEYLYDQHPKKQVIAIRIGV